MAILSTGNTFGDTDTVTSTKLNNIANQATFDDPVDETTLEKHTDGKLRIKANGVGTTQIASSAVTKAKIENVANMKVLGNTSGSATAPQEVDVIDDNTMATASATTLATSESIKAYVDDLIGYSTLPSQSNGLATEGEQGSYTLPGGLIVKYGTLNSTTANQSHTFTTSFPTAIIGVNATVNDNVSSASETCSVTGLTESGFTLNGYRGTSGVSVGRVFWTAYGY
jgi:hypothetical protein